MSEAKLVFIPISNSSTFIVLDGSTFENLHLYRSVICSLQYLAFKLPDISFVINKVCQYMNCPHVVSLAGC